VRKRNPQHVRARLSRAWIDYIGDAREGQAREQSKPSALNAGMPATVSLVEAVVCRAHSLPLIVGTTAQAFASS